MKILGLSSKNSGCGFHRIVLPLGFMNEVTGYVTDIPTDEILQRGYDILFFNRLSIMDEGLEEAKKHFKIIVDMDDDWILPVNHLNYPSYKELKPRIENNIRMADMVTCTNENLANKLRPLNSNVHIHKNALPFGYHQFTSDRRTDERIRIFWSGSCTHTEDLAILQNPLKRLSVHKDKIKMVLGGYSEDDPVTKRIWDKMFYFFTANGSLPYMKIGGTLPNDYMMLYENADIMLIPLEKSDWHGCKSNLKILEAAAKKIPCIVSAVEPYINDKDMPVLWVHKQKDWFEHLNYLILNPEVRIEMGEKLYNYAKENYSIFDVNATRRTAFADLIKT